MREDIQDICGWVDLEAHGRVRVPLWWVVRLATGLVFPRGVVSSVPCK